MFKCFCKIPLSSHLPRSLCNLSQPCPPLEYIFNFIHTINYIVFANRRRKLYSLQEPEICSPVCHNPIRCPSQKLLVVIRNLYLFILAWHGQWRRLSNYWRAEICTQCCQIYWYLSQSQPRQSAMWKVTLDLWNLDLLFLMASHLKRPCVHGDSFSKPSIPFSEQNVSVPFNWRALKGN